MEGLRAYQKYLAIKLHFTTDYDYFKYGGKSRSASPSSFEKRKDVFFFRKIERRYSDEELTDYFVANFVSKSTGRWIGELSSIQSEKTYDQWKKMIESFSYLFKQDMEKIKDNSQFTNPSDMWTVDNSNMHPEVLRLFLGNKVSLESMVGANRVLKFVSLWDRTITENFIWPDISKNIKKYDVFLKIDEKNIRKIMKEVFI
jgi:hypothetical protein